MTRTSALPRFIDSEDLANGPHDRAAAMGSNRASSSLAATPEKKQLRSRQVGWLPIADAAGRAGVSSRTLKRWIAAGFISATRLPSPGGRGHLRIRAGDLESLLAHGTLK